MISGFTDPGETNIPEWQDEMELIWRRDDGENEKTPPVNPFMVAILLAVFTVFMTGVPSSSRAKVQMQDGLGRSGMPSLGYLRVRDAIAVVSGCGDDIDPDGFNLSNPKGLDVVCLCSMLLLAK